MFEVMLLAIIILFVPTTALKVPLLIFAIIAVLPGAYATWTGAPYVPTASRIVRRMAELARIKPTDIVYDLGCGDGRLVFAAAKQCKKAIGYELSFPTFIVAKVRSLIHPRASIRLGNFWRANVSDADVVFCYLLTDSMKIFHQKIWPQLKPGCRVVSHTFKMKDLEPAHVEKDIVMYIK